MGGLGKLCWSDLVVICVFCLLDWDVTCFVMVSLVGYELKVSHGIFRAPFVKSPAGNILSRFTRDLERGSCGCGSSTIDY